MSLQPKGALVIEFFTLVEFNGIITFFVYDIPATHQVDLKIWSNIRIVVNYTTYMNGKHVFTVLVSINVVFKCILEN